MILVAVFALSGCETQSEPDPGETPSVTPEEEDEPTLELSNPATLTMNENLVATFEFSTNVNWSLSLSDTKSVPSWINVTPMSGSAGDIVLTISLEANPTVESRTSYIVINASELSETITVEQAAGDATISLSETEVALGAASGSFNITVNSNSEWVVADLPNWITVSPNSASGDTEVTISYEANDLEANRSTEIEFLVEGNSAELTVEQTYAADPQIDDLKDDTI